MCSRTDDCVEYAECSTNNTNKLAPGEKTCQCMEGFVEMGALCSGRWKTHIMLVRFTFNCSPATIENLLYMIKLEDRFFVLIFETRCIFRARFMCESHTYNIY